MTDLNEPPAAPSVGAGEATAPDLDPMASLAALLGAAERIADAAERIADALEEADNYAPDDDYGYDEGPSVPSEPSQPSEPAGGGSGEGASGGETPPQTGHEAILEPLINRVRVEEGSVRVSFGRNPAEELVPTHEYTVALGDRPPDGQSSGYAAFLGVPAGRHSLSIIVRDVETGDFSPAATKTVTVAG